MRFRPTAVVVLCLGLATSSAARADFGRLGGTTLMEAFTGATIDLDTPIAGMTISVKYLPGGHLSGDANAMLAISLGAAKDRGRWWVDGDKLCHKWFKWFDAAVQCLKVSRDGPRLRWVRDDGQSGTATIEDRLADLGALPSGLGVPPPTQTEAPLAEPPTVTTPPPAPAPQAANEPAQPVTPPPERAAAHAAAVPVPAPKPVETPTKTARPEHVAAVAAPPKSAEPAVPATVAARFSRVSYRIYGVADNDVLNVRETPSPTSRVIGAISPLGRGVRIIGTCVNTWCPVVHARGFGWVNRVYLVSEARTDGRRSDGSPQPRR